MQVRPTHYRPQTSKEAKAAYKKYGPRISSQEARQLERGAELYRRAEKIKEQEKRRKTNLKKRKEREEAEREKRRNGFFDPRGVPGSQILINKFLAAGGANDDGTGEEAAGQECPKTKTEDVNDAQDGDRSNELQESEDQAKGVEDLDLSVAGVEGSTQEPETRDCNSTKGPGGDVTVPYTDLLDLLVSNTQVQREISAESTPNTTIAIDFLSTQDVSFSTDELEDIRRPDPSLRRRKPGYHPPHCGSLLAPCSEKADQQSKLMLPPPPPLIRREPILFSSSAAKPAGSETLETTPLGIDLDYGSMLAGLDPADFLLSSQERREITG